MSANEKFRRLFRLDNDQRDIERAVDDELTFHFESTVRELVATGNSETDARREAERRFGDVERTRNGLKAIDTARARESRRMEWLENVLQDLRYAIRGMRRNPAFTISVVLILALGIGANATMFGIVDRLLLRAPAYLARDSEVHRVYLATNQNGKEFFGGTTSFMRFHDLVDSAKTIDAAVAYANPPLPVGVNDPRELHVTYASAGLWKFFDMQPMLGRFFTAAEDVTSNPAHVAVLGYNYWQSQLAANRDIVGTRIRLGRLEYTIIGVAPKGFVGLASQEPIAFVPLASGAENSYPGNGVRHWYNQYGFNWLQVVVRRKPNTEASATTAELDQRFRLSYAAGRAQNSGTVSELVAKPHAVVGGVLFGRGPNQSTDVKVALWLVGVAIVVLIIACANVSNLLLARALKRRREIALRLALGISRRRLFLQFLVESLLLASIGACAAIAVTEWGGRVLRATLLPDLAESSSVSDLRTILFTAAVAIVAGVCTGLAPALRTGSATLADALKSGDRAGNHGQNRLRFTLLVLQGALSVVLLVGAGLFVQSLNNVQRVPLGYDAENVLWVRPRLRGVVLDSIAERLMYERLIQAAEALPMVESASFGLSVPFSSEWEEPLFVAGIDSVDNLGSFQLQVVSPSYFKTLGTRIVRGRAITDGDRVGTPGAIVVSESMAKKLWPGKDALSQCIRVGADTMPCRYVVGIAEDIKSTKLIDEAPWQYYVPFEQYRSIQSSGVLFVRWRGTAASGVEPLRAALQRAMPGGSYVVVELLDEALSSARRSFELGATMFTLFGVLALLVASVGLYSVISYSVAQRTQEMGVRVALGAQRRDVLRLILGDAVGAALLAIALGISAALLASKWVSPLLFKTSPYDPAVYVGVAVTLLAVAIGAGIIPALRASRVSPSIALRSD